MENQKLFDRDVLNTIAERIKADVIENFETSGIRDGTGTLRGAVQDSDIECREDGDGFAITVRLADETRPARFSGGPTMRTRDYGQLVFGGRDAIVTHGGPMQFRYGGRWHVKREVGAAPPRPVYVLNESQQDDILEDVTKMVAEAALNILTRGKDT